MNQPTYWEQVMLPAEKHEAAEAIAQKFHIAKGAAMGGSLQACREAVFELMTVGEIRPEDSPGLVALWIEDMKKAGHDR